MYTMTVMDSSDFPVNSRELGKFAPLWDKVKSLPIDADKEGMLKVDFASEKEMRRAQSSLSGYARRYKSPFNVRTKSQKNTLFIRLISK